MQLELVRLQKTVGITFVIVTHDQAEALSMADRIAVMEEGVVRQVASPAELYEHPATRFVGDFIGQINLFDGKASAADEGQVKVTAEPFGNMILQGSATGNVCFAVRPEKVTISATRPAGAGLIAASGTVTDIAYYGGFSNVFVDIGSGEPVLAEITNSARAVSSQYSQGDTAWVSWRPEDTLLFDE